MDNVYVQADIDQVLVGLEEKIRGSVTHFWSTREGQSAKQAESGKKDAGSRGAATGGKQMDEFLSLVTELLIEVGTPASAVVTRSKLELPGYYRPTKKWDLLVVHNGQLLVAFEAKSQIGPSFGNNFNNRLEEAMGSALDLWTAFREGAFNKSARPWLGYLFLLEDCMGSRSPVRVEEPHFAVFPEYKGASYALRYELFCRKLMRERQYDSAAFLTANRETFDQGTYTEPALDLTAEKLLRSMLYHVIAQRSSSQ